MVSTNHPHSVNVPRFGTYCQRNGDHGPLTRYVKLLVAHAPGMPGTFSPPPTSQEPVSLRSRHAPRHVRDARAVLHVGIANPTVQGKRSRHFRRMRNQQFYVSDKRPMHVKIIVSWWASQLHQITITSVSYPYRSLIFRIFQFSNYCILCFFIFSTDFYHDSIQYLIRIHGL